LEHGGVGTTENRGRGNQHLGVLCSPHFFLRLDGEVLALDGRGEAGPEVIDIHLLGLDPQPACQCFQDDADQSHGLRRPVRAAVDDHHAQGALVLLLFRVLRALRGGAGGWFDGGSDGVHAAFLSRDSTSRRTTGATSVPRRSMASRCSFCGTPPNPICSIARFSPYSSW